MALTHRTHHGILAILASFPLVLGACSSNDPAPGSRSSAQNDDAGTAAAQPGDETGSAGNNDQSMPEEDNTSEGEGPNADAGTDDSSTGDSGAVDSGTGDTGAGDGGVVSPPGRIGGVVIPPVVGTGSPFGDLPAGATLSDAHIARILEVANMGEIAAANIELARGTTAVGKSFASTMVSAHTAGLNRAHNLEIALGGGVESPISLNLVAHNDAEKAGLSAAAAAEVDVGYLTLQVGDHTTVLSIIDTYLLPMATNAALRAELTTTRAAVASHLAMAKTALATVKP